MIRLGELSLLAPRDRHTARSEGGIDGMPHRPARQSQHGRGGEKHMMSAHECLARVAALIEGALRALDEGEHEAEALRQALEEALSLIPL